MYYSFTSQKAVRASDLKIFGYLSKKKKKMIRKNFILLLKRYSYIIMHSFASLVNLQKQLTRGVLRKRCSENMQ